MFEKIIFITRKTRLEELMARYGSERMARFHIEHGGGDFNTYSAEHAAYAAALNQVRPALAKFENVKVQTLDRELVKSYMFSNKDLIVTLGQDGLVANTAKYVGSQPIIALNPDPERFDGILLPFLPEQAERVVARVLSRDYAERRVTLAHAKLSDGQELLAFNDFFIGARSHVSARYQLEFAGHKESQSSSGIIVSTGAGSTGWMSSVLNMAGAIAKACGGRQGKTPQLTWEDERLVFAVREPFLSRASRTDTVFGFIDSQRQLVLESQMPGGGVLFSDGVEKDFLNFNSGQRVTIQPALKKAHLVTGV